MSDLDSLKKRAMELLAKARREERLYSRKAKALEAGYVHPDDEAAVQAIMAALAAPPAPAAVPVDVLRDAERYRWLREKAMLRGDDPAVLKDGPADCEFYFGEELDAAIDSAMFATHPQPAAAKDGDA